MLNAGRNKIQNVRRAEKKLPRSRNHSNQRTLVAVVTTIAKIPIKFVTLVAKITREPGNK